MMHRQSGNFGNFQRGIVQSSSNNLPGMLTASGGNQDVAPSGRGVQHATHHGQGVQHAAHNGQGVQHASHNGQGVQHAAHNGQGLQHAAHNEQSLQHAAHNGQGVQHAAHNGQGLQHVALGQGLHHVAHGQGIQHVAHGQGSQYVAHGQLQAVPGSGLQHVAIGQGLQDVAFVQSVQYTALEQGQQHFGGHVQHQQNSLVPSYQSINQMQCLNQQQPQQQFPEWYRIKMLKRNEAKQAYQPADQMLPTVPLQVGPQHRDQQAYPQHQVDQQVYQQQWGQGLDVASPVWQQPRSHHQPLQQPSYQQPPQGVSSIGACHSLTVFGQNVGDSSSKLHVPSQNNTDVFSGRGSQPTIGATSSPGFCNDQPMFSSTPKRYTPAPRFYGTQRSDNVNKGMMNSTGSMPSYSFRNSILDTNDGLLQGNNSMIYPVDNKMASSSYIQNMSYSSPGRNFNSTPNNTLDVSGDTTFNHTGGLSRLQDSSLNSGDDSINNISGVSGFNQTVAAAQLHPNIRLSAWDVPIRNMPGISGFNNQTVSQLCSDQLQSSGNTTDKEIVPSVKKMSTKNTSRRVFPRDVKMYLDTNYNRKSEHPYFSGQEIQSFVNYTGQSRDAIVKYFANKRKRDGKTKTVTEIAMHRQMLLQAQSKGRGKKTREEHHPSGQVQAANATVPLDQNNLQANPTLLLVQGSLQPQATNSMDQNNLPPIFAFLNNQNSLQPCAALPIDHNNLQSNASSLLDQNSPQPKVTVSLDQNAPPQEESSWAAFLAKPL